MRPDHKLTRLMIDGMTCGNCARHVTEALQSVAGVGSATVNLDAHQATVRWQANIRSRITGATVPTDMIDLIEVRDGRIVNFNEIFTR